MGGVGILVLRHTGPNPLTSALADQRAMSDRILAGLEYLQWSVSFDPVLALGLVIGGAAAWGTGGAQRWAVAGILAFIGAVLARGGDQWAGRLLTAPFLVAVLLQTRAPQLRPGLVTVLCGVAAMAGFVASAPTLRSDADFGVGARATRRPADQRRADYQATGLLLHRRDANVPVPEAAIRPRGLELSQNSVVVTQTPGFTGIKRGAGVHVIDPQGLTDPLLARLPAPVSPRRAGVQDRRIPDGYLDVLGGTGGRLADATLSIYYDRIVESSRGGLAQPGRMSSAWRLATGQMDSLIRESSYGPRQIAVHDLSSRRDDGTLAEAAGVVPIREGGVLVTFDAPTSIQGLDLSVSGNAAYIITVLHGDSTVERQAVRADVWATGALVTRRLTFSARQLATSVRIQCGSGDGKCAIGHLRVTP